MLSLVMCLCTGQYASAQTTKPEKPYHYEPNIPDVEAIDTLSALFIGNSFTFYFDTYSILQEIAASQGHKLNVRTALVGGYSFARHLVDPKTYAAIECFPDPYDYVFLQNQSQLNAQFAIDPDRFALVQTDAINLVERVREYSPEAYIILEATWASDVNSERFESKDDFDRCMWTGTCYLADACYCDVSPIGLAFAHVRENYPEINLLYKDHHHQSLAGAYLKSCVNYLLIYGGDFDEFVSNCTLEPEVAAKLRQAAKCTVEAVIY